MRSIGVSGLFGGGIFHAFRGRGIASFRIYIEDIHRFLATLIYDMGIGALFVHLHIP